MTYGRLIRLPSKKRVSNAQRASLSALPETPPKEYSEDACHFGLRREFSTMPKGQEKSKTTNKPKLTVKEKKAKKKEKAAK